MDGADLDTEMIRTGYEQGLFPMTVDEESDVVEWFYPQDRALLPITGIRVSRSLKRVIKSERYEVRFDTEFAEVMRSCMRPGDNWISEEFVRVYTEIFDEGWAHSSECWVGDELVGGVYGLAIGSCFCAESMFFERTDASKVALWALVNKCRDLGFTQFDAQIMNPHLASLGAYEVPHEEYEALLKDALSRSTKWSLPARSSS